MESSISVDMLIRQGHVIDPTNHYDSIMDVAIKGGTIFQIAPDLHHLAANKVIDASGLYVVPGLIDMHCHLYPHFPLAADGLACIEADGHLLRHGVTTCVDAGTCGARDFLQLKEQFIDHSCVRIFAMINIASGGMVNLESEQDYHNFLPHTVAGLAKDYKDIVIGVKTALYWVGKPFDDAHPAWASVDATLEAAELANLPAMIDFQPTSPTRTYEKLILSKLRPGDIHTHVYAQQFPILDSEGKLNPALLQARDRGVLFDLGHGAGSFWFRNAIPALKQGFYPDTFSTDLYFDKINGPVFGLTNVMSKYWNMGMELSEIIYRTTKRPAQVIGHSELGDLSVGSCADIALLEKQIGNFGFADSGRARMKGDKKLECVLTMRAGKIVYDLNALALTDWETAPTPYWVSPGVLP